MPRKPPDDPSRYPPHRLGARGERLAAERLANAGWRILARNYRLGRREVDIVARRSDLVAFVEVKTRSGSGYGGPESAVTRAKRREIEAVATDFLLRHPQGDVGVRFDVVAIELGPSGRVDRFEHIADAWRPDP